MSHDQYSSAVEAFKLPLTFVSHLKLVITAHGPVITENADAGRAVFNCNASFNYRPRCKVS